MPLLYLIRHGIAHDQGRDGSDFTRELTDEGRDKIRRQAHALDRAGLTPAHVVTSPLDRARQTAEVLADVWGVGVSYESALGLGARPAAYLDAYNAHEGRVVAVGHNPDISYAVHALTGARVQMRKGMVAAVKLGGKNAREGQLAGLYDPDALAEWGG